MATDVQAIEQLAAELEQLHPAEIVKCAVERYGPEIAVSFSGADAVLVHMAARTGLEFRAFTLDTGRLYPETHRLLEQVRERYGVDVEAYSPEACAVERLVREKGLFSFYRDGHEECCAIRKVEPLRRALAGRTAYVTGQRQDQSPATRAQVPLVQLDSSHGGADGPLIKFNPLARWTSAQLWQYIRAHDIPYNPLHERGFRSIGCEPCTRATNPGEHEREGRWWWEEATAKECGLHDNAPIEPPPLYVI